MAKFPYIKSFRIYTEKPPEEVYAVLKGGTTVWGMGHFPLGEGAFVGEVGASDFKVMPRPTWFRRTYSMVVMEGSIRAEEEETVVDVKMRFPWQVYLFFPILFGMGGYAVWDARAFPVVCKMLFLFICVCIFIAWIYVRIEFYFEARRARENMEDLLGGETVDT